VFDWLTGFVENMSYLGIALLMFAENVFPPLPSELIMPLAGFLSAEGKLNIFFAVLAGTIASTAGALFWYGVGWWLGAERLKRWAGRHGRWLTISPEEVDHVCRWFGRHGGKAVFFGRLVPTIRSMISVPAGIAGMGLGKFLLYSVPGTALWTGFLAGAGYMLESQYHKVSGYMNPVANVIMGLIVLCYLYRVVTFRKTKPA
jgi:membrane protein DedA with SNARE-associated domain